jgi:hypothetical protein
MIPHLPLLCKQPFENVAAARLDGKRMCGIMLRDSEPTFD